MKKLRFSFVIGCLCLALSACAQNNSLRTQLELLQKPASYKFPIDSTGFSVIKNAKFYSDNGDLDVFDINSSNIHLVDVNNDGAKDMIYQDNRHYLATALLVKKGNDFVEIWNGSGALVHINKEEQTRLYVLSPSIGCIYMTRLTEVIINNDNTLTKNTLALHSDTAISAINKVFEQQTISGTLRTQPIIDNTEKIDPCSGDLKKGNQMRIIKSKEITIIKKQSDWLLVVLKEKNQSIIGWVQI